MKKKIILFMSVALSLVLFSSCKDDTAGDGVVATVKLRQCLETEEPNLDVMARTLVLEVKGENIESGWAGIFKSSEISEPDYEKSIANMPIDASDIKAINSERGWIRKFHNLECTAPENDREGFQMSYTAVVKLVDKTGASKIFTASQYTMLEPPPM